MGQPIEFCMPLLLRKWGLERATGTLTVTAPYPAAIVNIVLVENGAVVFATSRNRRDPTGELYIELFHLPEADPENMDEIGRIEYQVTKVVADMFDWPVAEVSFQDGIHLTRWPRLPLPVADLMLRGMRKVSDTERVLRWIGDPDQIFAHASDPFSIFYVPLKPEEAFFLSRIDGATTVRDLLSGGGLELPLAARLLAALLFAGAIEPISDRKVAKPWIGAIPPTLTEGQTAVRPQAQAVDVAEAARFWYLVEEKLRDVEEGKDYYALLEVERRASADAIQAKYDELARVFHPDRYRHLAPGHIDVERHLDSIFNALTTACVVLTNPHYKEIYDRQLAANVASKGIRVTPPPVRYATAPLPPPVVKTPPPRPSTPLPPPEKPAPARMPPPVVASPPSPAPPADNQPAAPLPTSSASFSAEDWFKRGAQFAAVNDHERAVHAYELAFPKFEDSAQFLVAFGRSLSQLSTKRKRAEEILLKAAKLAPLAPVPLLELGLLYAKAGKRAEARAMLEQALDLKPNLEAAKQAIAELDVAEKNMGSGLLKKLLRK